MLINVKMPAVIMLINVKMPAVIMLINVKMSAVIMLINVKMPAVIMLINVKMPKFVLSMKKFNSFRPGNLFYVRFISLILKKSLSSLLWSKLPIN